MPSNTYTDPKKGGDLSDMAVDGATIPEDAGKQNLIPSVPRPDQIDSNGADGLGQPDLAGAADNASDIPRNFQDRGGVGESVTGTGDALPAETTTKNLHFGRNDPLSKGHARYDKHVRQETSEFDRVGEAEANVEPAPGEEEESQSSLREKRRA